MSAGSSLPWLEGGSAAIPPGGLRRDRFQMGDARWQAELDAARGLIATDRAAATVELRRLAAAPEMPPGLLHAIGLQLYMLGESSDALLTMERALAISPTAAMLNDLGSMRLRAGAINEAIDAYQRCVSLDPRYALGWGNLADAQASAGDYGSAVASYRRAISLGGETDDVLIGLADALARTGSSADALAVNREAVQKFPASAPAWHALAIAERRAGACSRAVECQRRALELAPREATYWHALGNLLDDLEDVPAAGEAYRRALALRPDFAEAQYDLAALGLAEAPPVMPRRYTVRLFDDFAPTFEHELVDQLGYRAPGALRGLVERHVPAARLGELDVLDLGCGTGLVGKQIRPWAKTLTGVDLSPRMLDECRRLGIYDRLEQADVIEFLSRSERFDLVLAADLLIYIGDAAPLLTAVANGLRPGGWFALSIETIAEGRFLLRRTRRYAHSLRYLEDSASRADLAWLDGEAIPLRRQGAGFVQGHAVLLGRS